MSVLLPRKSFLNLGSAKTKKEERAQRRVHKVARTELEPVVRSLLVTPIPDLRTQILSQRRTIWAYGLGSLIAKTGIVTNTDMVRIVPLVWAGTAPEDVERLDGFIEQACSDVNVILIQTSTTAVHAEGAMIPVEHKLSSNENTATSVIQAIRRCTGIAPSTPTVVVAPHEAVHSLESSTAVNGDFGSEDPRVTALALRSVNSINGAVWDVYRASLNY